VIKILHAADFHMDSPYDALPGDQSAARRAEMRALLEKTFDFARESGVQLILLSGDLLDSAASYHETRETLVRVAEKTDARIFIAPGNHDYYAPASPYSYLEFPPNVHIFRSPRMTCVELPELNCRVWGAGFNAPLCPPLLRDFAVSPAHGVTDIMVLHGDVTGGEYNPISERDIAESGLHYLALGHIHTFSGFQRAGGTVWAYPGCLMGRGFDETGEKGFITGTVSAERCNLRFVPAGGREYRVLDVPLTGLPDAEAAVRAALPQDANRHVYRVVCTGEYAGGVNARRLEERLAPDYYRVTVRDRTRLPRDIWAGLEEDTLTGGFLRKLKEQSESAPDDREAICTMAVRFGLAALEEREEWQP
jgi:exonuclease SbcD